MYTQAECFEKYGSKYYTNKVMEEGGLYHVNRGNHSEKEYVPKLSLLSFKYPKTIMTMRNAWFIHGLTDVVPDEYDFATDKDAAKITNKRAKQIFYPKEILVASKRLKNKKVYEVLAKDDV